MNLFALFYDFFLVDENEKKKIGRITTGAIIVLKCVQQQQFYGAQRISHRMMCHLRFEIIKVKDYDEII